MIKSLKMLDQIIEKARFDDQEYKKEMIRRHEGSKTVGESWMIFHLSRLKEIIQEESKTKSTKMELPAGQMSQTEREYIFSVTKDIEAKVVLESGTWLGGGSTLSLTKGVKETGGMLHTFEEHQEFYTTAKQFYDQSEYTDFIKLYNTSFMDGLKSFPSAFFDTIDLVLLDGGDELPNGLHKMKVSDYQEDYNLSENVQSFRFLEDKIKSGCHLLLHDWSDADGRGSFVKNYLKDTQNTDFEFIRLINTTTGLAHLKKK